MTNRRMKEKIDMKNVKILGSGSADCVELEELVVQVANELGMEYAIERVTTINSILSYGVILSPGLVIDDEVKSAGKVPTAEDIKLFLTEPPEAERSMGEGFKNDPNQKDSQLPF